MGAAAQQHTAATAPGRREDLVCPDCAAPMRLKDSRYGLFYGCIAFPRCRTCHGAHPDGAPLGVPANKATRDARIKAHAAFDELWKREFMSRGAAYAWLARALDLPGEAHMGEMDFDQCARVVVLCAAKLAELEATAPRLRELRKQVRAAFRAWGQRHRRDARVWAAEILGLDEWPGTDALTEDQLAELLIADEDRLAQKALVEAKEAVVEVMTDSEMRQRVRRLATRIAPAEADYLRSFAASPREPTKAERKDINRLSQWELVGHCGGPHWGPTSLGTMVLQELERGARR